MVQNHARHELLIFVPRVPVCPDSAPDDTPGIGVNTVFEFKYSQPSLVAIHLMLIPETCHVISTRGREHSPAGIRGNFYP